MANKKKLAADRPQTKLEQTLDLLTSHGLVQEAQALKENDWLRKPRAYIDASSVPVGELVHFGGPPLTVHKGLCGTPSVFLADYPEDVTCSACTGLAAKQDRELARWENPDA